MLMLQYFPSSHHANRANNGALMKISRQNAAAQTAAWIAINFPFCWHGEKNEHCLHVWLLHKSNLSYFILFFHLGKLYMKRKASREQCRALTNKRLAFLFPLQCCFLSIKHSSVARSSAGELEFLWLCCSALRPNLSLSKFYTPDWEYHMQEGSECFICSFILLAVEAPAAQCYELLFVSCDASFVYQHITPWHV